MGSRVSINCDKCGVESVYEEDFSHVRANKCGPKFEEGFGNEDFSLDLCKLCFDDVFDFVPSGVKGGDKSNEWEINLDRLLETNGRDKDDSST